MSGPLSIAMTCCGRPQYLRRALSALASCRGIAGCRLTLSVEPGDAEVDALAESARFCETRVIRNRERLGCNANTAAALDAAFLGGSDFAVLVESDVLLAPDALGYLAWARDRFRSDPGVFSATAYNRAESAPPAAASHEVQRRPWFHPWGMGMWADRWHSARHLLTDPSLPDDLTWDARVNDRVRAGGLVEVFPVLSRCQNFGAESTLHDPAWFTPAWHQEHHHVRHWAGEIDPGPGRWHEAAGQTGQAPGGGAS